VLNLSLSTDLISLITSAGSDIAVHASWVDRVTATEVQTPDKTNTAIAGAATTTIVAHGGVAGTVRNIKSIVIRNYDAVDATDITVQFNANGTLYELFKCTLLVGEELVCREGTWFHYDANGGVYGGLPAASTTVGGAIRVATQAEMETATSVALAVSPGNQHFHPGHPKAWLSCGVAGDIQQSYNITGLVDSAVGLVTITIATDFGAATYCIVNSVEATMTGSWLVASARETHVRVATRAAGSVALDCIDNTATANLLKDPTTYHAAMFGDFA
jgi:hypothetical protein